MTVLREPFVAHASCDNLRLHRVLDPKLGGEQTTNLRDAVRDVRAQTVDFVDSAVPFEAVEPRQRLYDVLCRVFVTHQEMVFVKDTQVLGVDLDTFHGRHVRELAYQRKISVVDRFSKLGQLVLHLEHLFGLHDLVDQFHGQCVQSRSC